MAGDDYNLNPLHDSAKFVGDLLSGPKGDPDRLRQIARTVDSVRQEWGANTAALTGAVDALTTAWTGDGATAFHATWHATGGRSKSAVEVFGEVDGALGQLSRALWDLSDQIEHAQHEHLIGLVVLAVLTVVNVAQLGLDPGTDAAEGVVAGGMVVKEIVIDLALGSFEGITLNLGTQFLADEMDFHDPDFDHTGDGVVPLVDVREAAVAGITGGLTEGANTASAFLRSVSLGGADSFGSRILSSRLFTPASRIFNGAAASGVTALGDELIRNRGEVNWSNVRSGVVSGLETGVVSEASGAAGRALHDDVVLPREALSAENLRIDRATDTALASIDGEHVAKVATEDLQLQGRLAGVEAHASAEVAQTDRAWDQRVADRQTQLDQRLAGAARHSDGTPFYRDDAGRIDPEAARRAEARTEQAVEHLEARRADDVAAIHTRAHDAAAKAAGGHDAALRQLEADHAAARETAIATGQQARTGARAQVRDLQWLRDNHYLREEPHDGAFHPESLHRKLASILADSTGAALPPPLEQSREGSRLLQELDTELAGVASVQVPPPQP